jgi:hypothetical protein
MYSVFVGNGSKQLNEPAGHLLRTKFLGTDEGGVASGFACLSSPLLVDDSYFLTAKALNSMPSAADVAAAAGCSAEPADAPMMKRQRSDNDPKGV